jgi:NADH-quinone oxidoreductase subunit J
MTGLGLGYFYACAAFATLGALGAVAARNPIRCAMGLLMLILGVAGLFLSLHAQFLAAVQLIVYAGAVVVLFLFVIMLLGPTVHIPDDGRGLVPRAFSGSLFALAGGAAIVAVWRAVAAAQAAPKLTAPDSAFGGIEAFGDVLFSDALVPFELSSALLMVAVVGAVAVARGRQGKAAMSKSELDAARAALPAPEVSSHSRVFSHESAGSASQPASVSPGPPKEATR